MTLDDLLTVVEEGYRMNDGFWNEAEAAKLMPVTDVTHKYIKELSEHGDTRNAGEGAVDRAGDAGGSGLAEAA